MNDSYKQIKNKLGILIVLGISIGSFTMAECMIVDDCILNSKSIWRALPFIIANLFFITFQTLLALDTRRQLLNLVKNSQFSIED